MSYGAKLGLCVLVDLFDFTLGRLLVFPPFVGEILGAAVACSLFGRPGLLYLIEGLDVTEQIDGFVPTATLIALSQRP